MNSHLGLSESFDEERKVQGEEITKPKENVIKSKLAVSDIVMYESYDPQNDVKDHQQLIQQGLTQKLSMLLGSGLERHRPLMEEISKLQAIYACKEDERFSDQEFLLKKETLFAEPTKIARIDRDLWENIKIYNLENRPPSLFEGIGCQQLSLECPSLTSYDSLASALFILATMKPQALSRLFEVEEINKEGIYAVWINTCGEWKLVILDDCFPLYWGECPFIKASSKNNSNLPAFWILLLEKALAKTYGGYDMLQDLNIDQALGDITGCPLELKDYDDEDDMWSDARKWIESGFLVFLALKPGVKGLSADRSIYFPVLDTRSEIIAGSLKKFFKLRALSRDLILESKTIDLTDSFPIIGQFKQKEAFFWLSLSEVRENFTSMGCLKYNECNVYKSLRVATKKNSALLLVTLNSDCKQIYFGVHQMDERLFRQRKESGFYHYSFVRLLVARVEKSDLSNINEQSLAWVAGEFSNDRVVWLKERPLESGVYLVAIEGEWTSGCREFTFMTYSSNDDVSIEVCSQAIDFLSIQKSIITKLALSDSAPQTQKVRDYSKQNEPDIKVYFDMNFGMLYFYYSNNGKKLLRETVTMTSLKNLIICAPFSNSRFFNIELAPGESEVVIYKYDISGEEFSYQSSIRSTIEQYSPGDHAGDLSNIELVFEDLGPQKINRDERDSKEDVTLYLNSLKFTNVDLMRFMEQNCQKEFRVWEGREIDVFVYKYPHQEGVVVLYLNYTDFAYEEYISFELNNLKLVNKSKDGNLNIVLKAYEYHFVFLNVVRAKDPYAFKIRSYYKYFPE